MKKYFWYKDRLNDDNEFLIIRVDKFGESLPQTVDGEVLETKTGEIKPTFNKIDKELLGTDRSYWIFTADLGEEVSGEELQKIKKKIKEKIDMF